MFKRGISILLAASMTAALIPSVYADDDTVKLTAKMDEAIDVVKSGTGDDGDYGLDAGLFTSSDYYCDIDRDYAQYLDISVENVESADKEVYFTCGDVSGDLAVNFIESGSKSEPMLLRANESANATLAVFAQNASESNVGFYIYAWEVINGTAVRTSAAYVDLNIDISGMAISVEKISENSASLEQTYQITNTGGNSITDLSFSFDDDIKDYVYTSTPVENYLLASGESVTFSVCPDLGVMDDNDMTSLSGTVIITGNGDSYTQDVSFDIGDNEIVYSSVKNIQQIQDGNPFINLTPDYDSVYVNDVTISEDGFNVETGYNLLYGDDLESTLELSYTMTGTPVSSGTAAADTFNIEESGGEIIATMSYTLTAEEYSQIYDSVYEQYSFAFEGAEASVHTMDIDIPTAIDITLTLGGDTELGGKLGNVFAVFQAVACACGFKKDMEKVQNYLSMIPDYETREQYKMYVLAEYGLTVAGVVGIATGIGVEFGLASIITSLVASAEREKIEAAVDAANANKGDDSDNAADVNTGGKFGASESGSQCTNKGLIESNFKVPGAVNRGTSRTIIIVIKPDKESGTVEKGTKVSFSAPKKRYYSTWISSNHKPYTQDDSVVIDNSTKVTVVTKDDRLSSESDDSESVTYVYLIDGQPLPPEPSVESGTVEKGTELTLTPDNGEDVYYYIDTEFTDDTEGFEYSLYDGPITLDQSCVVYTYAQNDSGVISEIIPLQYIVGTGVSALEDEEDSEETVSLFYTGRVYSEGSASYVDNEVISYEYCLNGKSVAQGENNGLTEVDIQEIPTDYLNIGGSNNFVRDYDTDAGHYIVSTDNQFTVIYPEDYIVSYVGSAEDLFDMRLKPDFSVYAENIYCDDDLIIGHEANLKVNYYNRGSQSGFYTINVYNNGELLESKENEFMTYFSSGSVEIAFTPQTENNNITVEILNTSEDLDEETEDNNTASKAYTARAEQVPVIENLSPDSDVEQTDDQIISTVISNNADVSDVSFSLDGSEVQSTVKSSGTSYWCSAGKLAVGTHTVKVTVNDKFGNVYELSSDFTVTEAVEHYTGYYFDMTDIDTEPNVEINLNDYVKVVDTDSGTVYELKDFADVLEITTASSIISINESNPLLITATDTGSANIYLTMGDCADYITVYSSLYGGYSFNTEQDITAKSGETINIGDYITVNNNGETIQLSELADKISIYSYDGLDADSGNAFVYTMPEEYGEYEFRISLADEVYDYFYVYVTSLNSLSGKYTFTDADADDVEVTMLKCYDSEWSGMYYGYDTETSDNTITVSIDPYYSDYDAYKAAFCGDNFCYIDDFTGGDMEISIEDLATLYIDESNADIMYIEIYAVNGDEETYIGEVDNNVKLSEGAYRVYVGFMYDGSFNYINKYITVSSAETIALDPVSCINYITVNAQALDGVEELYIGDGETIEYASYIIGGNSTYKIVPSDDMIANPENYTVYAVGDGFVAAAPLTNSEVVLTMENNKTLQIIGSENVELQSYTIRDIGEEESWGDIAGTSDTISLPAAEYTVYITFTSSGYSLSESVDVSTADGDAVIDLSDYADINIGVSWPKIYGNYIRISFSNIDAGTSSSFSGRKESYARKLSAGTYSWSAYLYGNDTYDFESGANITITDDELTEIAMGSTFTGTLSAYDGSSYRAGGEAEFVLNDVADEYGNILTYTSSSSYRSAKIIFTNVYDASDVYESAVDNNRMHDGQVFTATLPDTPGKYTVELVIESIPYIEIEGTYYSSDSSGINRTGVLANLYGVAEGSQVIAAFYGYSGVLLAAQTETYDGSGTIDLSVDSAVDWYDIKIYAWDSMESMIPAALPASR
ncbi:MAG: hypothetical protein LUF26_04090 [Firmicutes bacterium]|nr:hypothetical protein [Bacillota bacterium]